MRLLYFTLADFAETYGGVYKKVLAHTKIFRQEGYEVDLVYKRDGLLFINTQGGEEIVLGKSGKNFTRGFLDTRLIQYMKQEKYDIVFIRYPNTDALFNRLLRIWKHNGSKIMIEFPTYPYDAEFNVGVVRRIRLMLDRLHRVNLKKYVTGVATYSAFKEIYGIPTVKIINGIDFSEVPLLGPVYDAEHIHMVAISTMYPWHGYDRLILGVAHYYENGGARNIIIHMVGEGPEKAKYQQIVEDYHLEEHVIFHGAKSGKELDDIYSMSDIGIQSLGLHRLGLPISTTLKSREYAAKGLPMVTSCEMDIFPAKQYDFVCEISGDESPVDIETIIEFYDSMYENVQNAEDKLQQMKKIRERASGICDMYICMKPIFEWIKDVTI